MSIFKLKSGSEALKPVSGTSYSVGERHLQRMKQLAFGYKQKNGSVEVNRADKTERVKLGKAQPVVTVTFAYDKDKDAVNGGKNRSHYSWKNGHGCKRKILTEWFMNFRQVILMHINLRSGRIMHGRQGRSI